MNLRMLLLAWVTAGLLQQADAARPAAPRYVFTDEPVRLNVATGTASPVACSVRTITDAGWGPTSDSRLEVRNATVTVKPLIEGIHIVTLMLDEPQEERFLAIRPPPRPDKRAVRASLPLAGRDLLAGRPVNILAMGDSVTATGHYAELLRMLLSRATGNRNLRATVSAHAGKSIDATVRTFDEMLRNHQPAVGLLMYGLNEQAAGYDPAAYLEQCRWISDRLRTAGADTIWMTSTPDLSRSGDAPYGSYLIRMMGYVGLLEQLGRETGVPVVNSFSALWGRGGPTLDAAGRAMWPLYPLNYDRQLTSMLESEGRGDGIHPGSLGHLRMARALYDRIARPAPPPPELQWSGSSRWTATGLVSRITVRNARRSASRVAPRFLPLPDHRLSVDDVPPVTVAAGTTATWEVAWPALSTPADLFTFPASDDLSPFGPMVVVLERTSGALASVAAPMEVQATLERVRLVAPSNDAAIPLVTPTGKREVPVRWNDEVGRIRILQSVDDGQRTGWAAAEVAYVRYGAAAEGEASMDGDLAEWEGHVWSTVGAPAQARWTRGPLDRRASPDECLLRWAFKAGSNGVHLAVDATGTVTNDHFILFFDPRRQADLGTPGRYYWVSGGFGGNGRMSIGRGETSPSAPGLGGAWQTRDQRTCFEIFVPYAALEMPSWPAEGDLGLSIWWRHQDKERGETNLMWAEDGHAWNPRWYGVVRRTGAPAADLPFRVRVK